MKKTIDYDTNIPSSHALFVSLYLVVLAFFIVLNSISEQDMKKTKRVMANIGLTFSGERGTLERDVKPIGFLTSSQVIADFFERVESYIIDSFKLVEIQKTELGSRMYIKFPVETMFDPVDKTLIPRRVAPFRNIAKMASEFSKFNSLNINIYINSPALMTDVSAAQQEIYYVSKIADYIIASGFSKKNLSIGVAPSKERNIVIEIEALK